jgi:hypothetical protein
MLEMCCVKMDLVLIFVRGYYYYIRFLYCVDFKVVIIEETQILCYDHARCCTLCYARDVVDAYIEPIRCVVVAITVGR